MAKNISFTIKFWRQNGPREKGHFDTHEMKVKDLRDYLSLHDISTDMCREKEELVFLVLSQQPVISQDGRTQAPPLGPDFPEQQAFLSRPHTSTVPPTSPGLQSAPPGQAQGRQQVRPVRPPVSPGRAPVPLPPSRGRGAQCAGDWMPFCLPPTEGVFWTSHSRLGFS